MNSGYLKGNQLKGLKIKIFQLKLNRVTYSLQMVIELVKFACRDECWSLFDAP